MERTEIMRENCLFKTKSIAGAINTLISELGNDLRENQLLTCSRCQLRLESEECENYHAYLQSIYDTLLRLKSALNYLQ